MNQSATIQQLTDRLRRVEAEIIAVREELKALPEKQSPPTPIGVTVPYIWVNKATLKKQIRYLFQTFSIQGAPVGAESFQKQMREAELTSKLTSNELSQSIIAAREE